MNLDTSYYNGEKTEYTAVDGRTHMSHSMMRSGEDGSHVKHENFGTHGYNDATNYDQTQGGEQTHVGESH